MKKICKMLMVLVLTFTMVTNMAPASLHAEGGNAFAKIGITDQFFINGIVDHLVKVGTLTTADSALVTDEMLKNLEGTLDINGNNPRYAGLESIKGFTRLGKDSPTGNTLNLVIQNCSELQVLPDESDNPDVSVLTKPGLTLTSSAIRDVSQAKLLGTDIFLNQFTLGGQQVKYSSDQTDFPNQLHYQYNKINDRESINKIININKVLKNDKGIMPTLTGHSDNSDAGAFNYSNYLAGEVSISNLIKDTDLTFNWRQMVTVYGNTNPWSGVLTVPLTVDYKQDVTIDTNKNGEANGTVSLESGEASSYFKYKNNVNAIAKPDSADRSVQYWRTVKDDENVATEINADSENESVDLTKGEYYYTLNALNNVNHIHTKFTHIADIKNVTESEKIGGKKPAEAGQVTVSENSEYSNTASEEVNNETVYTWQGSTGIKDNETRTFTITPSDSSVYEIDEVTLNGKLLKSGDDYTIDANGVGTFAIEEINEDQHVTASFRLKQKYEMKAEVIENTLTKAEGSEAKDEEIDKGTSKNHAGENVYFVNKDGQMTSSENEIISGSNRSIAVRPALGYVIDTLQIDKIPLDKDGNPTTDIETTTYDDAKNKVSYDVEIEDIMANYKVTVSYKALHNAVARAMTNKVMSESDPASTTMDDGLNGGTLVEKKNISLNDIARGDTRIIKIKPNEDTKYVIKDIKVYQEVNNVLTEIDNDEYVALGLKNAKGENVFKETGCEVRLSKIQKDYIVEASFVENFAVDTEVVANSKNEPLDNGVAANTGNHKAFNSDKGSLAEVSKGDNRVVNVTANARLGYKIESIKVFEGNSDIEASEGVTVDKVNGKVILNNVRKDYTVKASFVAQNTVKATRVSNGKEPLDNGLVEGNSVSDNLTLDRGDRGVVNITADTKNGYAINSIEITKITTNEDGSTTSTEITLDNATGQLKEDLKAILEETKAVNPLHFDNVTDNYEVNVSFAAKNSIVVKAVSNSIYEAAVKLDPKTNVDNGVDGFIKLTSEVEKNLTGFDRKDTKEFEISANVDKGYKIESIQKIHFENGQEIKENVAFDNDTKAVVKIENIVHDYTVNVAFTASQYVKTESKTNTTGTDATIGGEFDEELVTKFRGESATVTARAHTEDGYVIETFTVYKIDNNGEEVLFKDLTRTFSGEPSATWTNDNLRENYKVYATYVAKQTLKGKVVPNNAGEGYDDGVELNQKALSKDVEVNRGQDGSIIVTPNTALGYEIETLYVYKQIGVDEDGNPVYSDKPEPEENYSNTPGISNNSRIITVNDLKENYLVTASFIAKYDVTTKIVENKIADAGDNGLKGGTVNPSKTDINRGGSHEVVVEANEEYVIHSIVVDGKEIVFDNETLYTIQFKDITANHNVEVSFKRRFIVRTETKDPNGHITPTEKKDDGSPHTVVITPNDGYEVDMDSLENTGGVITKNPDGTVTITFDHVIRDEDIKVGFKKIEKPAPTPEPEKPAPKKEAPTGDTTSTLPLAGLAVASLVACGFILKKRKSNMK